MMVSALLQKSADVARLATRSGDRRGAHASSTPMCEAMKCERLTSPLTSRARCHLRFRLFSRCGRSIVASSHDAVARCDAMETIVINTSFT